MVYHKIFSMKFSKVHQCYIDKAERKNRTKEEVDQIISWLTGYNQLHIRNHITLENDLKTFFSQAPAINKNSSSVKGAVCGVRIDEINDPLMRNIRILDKLIDELAKGKSMEKILR